jgi:hypothetical protein
MNAARTFIERHDTGPPDSWRSSRANTKRLRDAILARQPRAADGAALLACDRDCAAVLSVLDESIEAIARALAQGTGAGAAGAMAQAAGDGGFVLLREPESSGPRVMPAGAADMTPLLWRDALMLALIVRDRNAQTILLDPARIAACQVGERADRFWPAYCRALAAVVARSASAESEIVATSSAMEAIEIADPAVVDALDRPLLALAARLVDGSDDWSVCVADGLMRHRAWFSDERRRYDRSGFLATGIFGLCSLARDRGITTSVDSPYIPREMIEGTVRPPLSQVTRSAGAVHIDTIEDMTAALTAAAGLKELLRPVLMRLRGPDYRQAVAALRPHKDDYAKVFIEPSLERARNRYDSLWRAPPPFPPPDPTRTDLRIDLAPAGMLAGDNLLSKRFPLGYRAVAPLLVPERIWAAWEFVEPGRDSGLAFDGLVWCEDHWAWFPRPYLMLGAPES